MGGVFSILINIFMIYFITDNAISMFTNKQPYINQVTTSIEATDEYFSKEIPLSELNKLFYLFINPGFETFGLD